MVRCNRANALLLRTLLVMDRSFHRTPAPLLCLQPVVSAVPRGIQEWSEIKEQAGTFSDILISELGPAMRLLYSNDRFVLSSLTYNKAHVRLVPSEKHYTLECSAIG